MAEKSPCCSAEVTERCVRDTGHSYHVGYEVWEVICSKCEQVWRLYIGSDGKTDWAKRDKPYDGHGGWL